ncbi:SUKH-4 family immunity protein [Actinomadura sp. 3N407]|uniref:SUKH-4 family immunity protein n=1 Tax=Actinomadura sp. 3N407 TaxID=3457423 RepID=UPI003FCE049F
MTAEIITRFGPEGLRRVPAGELPGELPGEAAAALADPGLPLQVGPYFTASTGEPLALGEYAATVGFPDAAPDTADWCRIGTDHGAEMCVSDTGDVQAVFVTATAPPMTVNTDVPAFVASLLALDRYLPPLASPGDRNPAEIFRELRGTLLRIDEPALEDDEAWWPRVLEQIRHALSFPFAAAIEYEDAGGGRHVETEEARVGLPHPERLLWDRLDARGIAPGQVTRVYTELEPCFLPGNYCRMRLSRFRNAEFTYSHDYGATADERERGLLELMQQAAQET